MTAATIAHGKDKVGASGVRHCLIYPGPVGWADHRGIVPLLASLLSCTPRSPPQAFACVHSSRAALVLGQTLASRAKALFQLLVLSYKARLGWDPIGLSTLAEKPFDFFEIKRKSLVH